MTAEEFRELALGFPNTVESSHMGHPDFRVNGKIFATLSNDPATGTVALNPQHQEEYMALDPAFHQAPGGWGRNGSTLITLASANRDVVRSALAMACDLRTKKK